ncbi:MAG: hypothetical protein ACT4PG_00685 [Panacagrimonas sp.]
MKVGLLVLIHLLLALPAWAAPMNPRDVPDPLKPWIPWVLHDQQARFCPPTPDAAQRLCHWPSRLALDLSAEGGRFELQAAMLAPGWLPLPGDGPRWPQEVSLDGRDAPVLDHQGQPALWLDAGEHRVQGQFDWNTLPESLRVPPASGQVELKINGRAVPHPQRDEQQRLWLGRRAVVSDAQTERLGLRVFRLIDDDIPLRVTTEIQIDVGGEPREDLIGPALLDGLVPLSLSGDLPARLEADGRLRVQLRPGVWTLTLVARSRAPVAQLSAPAASEFWATQEVWSWLARHELRVVETSGLPAADPRQVGVPEPWQNLPAFLVEPGATLKLSETQRGSTDLQPDALHLSRQLWLDFDGGGFTAQDQLSGQLARTWRLEAQAPITLGRVQVDGQPQLITRHGEGTGVEVRHGALNLSADSRIENGTGVLPAGGWNTDLQGVDATLHLPPAWRLIAAPGVDRVSDTWLARWTLLDLFLVLIAVIAALRLFGRGTAVLTLLTLALTWHEPGAPQWAWLNLIAAIALLRALPTAFDTSGRLRKFLLGYQWIAAGVLALVVLPFAIQQARISLYPQLDPHHGFAHFNFGPSAAIEAQVQHDMADGAGAAPEMAREVAPAAMADNAVDQGRGLMSKAQSEARNVSQASIQKLDPNVLTQTGPGLPAWGWRQASLSWSGPVTAEQSFRLWLMPPLITRSLGWLSIALIALLALRWLQAVPRLPNMRAGASAAGTLGAILIAGLITLAPPPVQAQDHAPPIMPPQAPTQDLLDQLRDRLSAPPDCLPACANWSRLAISIAPDDRLVLRLTAEAQIDTALPLPVPPLTAGQNRVWQPQTVLINERAAQLLRDERGALWLRVPAGRHRVVLGGDLSGFAQLSLPLAPAPRQVTVDASGWQVSGVDAQGQAASAIDLIRERKEPASSAHAQDSAQTLPALLRLTRTLQLGLVWSVESNLARDGDAQGAHIASVPALPGEVVTGDAVRVVDGRIQASFAPGQSEVSWTSRLNTVPELQLKAGTASDQIETWRFDISPLWHVEFDGLGAVSTQEADWRLVSFRPWPGESLRARITRPAAVEGQVMTLDLSELRVQPGRRATDYEWTLRLRASQGGQHSLNLPARFELQGLSIDGVPQPARREGERLILPLRPGEQTPVLNLRVDEGLSVLTHTPALHAGLPGVNARLEVRVPEDRWVLLVGGPTLGPAVLFWAVLAVLMAVAIALGRLGLTPLKGAQWALLMIGLSQVPIAAVAVVAGWLFALALRARMPLHWSARRFNFVQIVLALWTVLALSTLFGAVAQGLLGTPDMQIAGNNSHAGDLHWYQDRFDTHLPQAWVLSVSIWFYRGLMLLWALWLANSLLNWLRWGWVQYSSNGVWKKSAVIVAAPATVLMDNAPRDAKEDPQP